MINRLSDRQKKGLLIGILILFLLILFLLILFVKPTYTITFNSNGGSSVASVAVKENDKLEEPEDPTRDGYIFTGWYYYNRLYDFGLPITQDMTLKAEWEKEGSADVSGVSLNLEELDIAPGGTAVLEATVTPEDAKNKSVIWTSSDEEVVTVDENGNLTALKKGTATITVTTEEGAYTATCAVTVTSEVTLVEGVSISGANQVNVGGTIKLTATVKPSDATNKSVTWSSSNPYVARVDTNGNVTGLIAGTITITVATVDGNHKATHSITVKANTNSNNNNEGSNGNQPENNNNGESSTPSEPNTPQSPDTPQESTIVVSNIRIEGASELFVGADITLQASIEPANATNKNVTWSSSDPSVATVDNGKVHGVKAGTAIITVTTADGGHTATHTVNVKENSSTDVEVTSVSISGGKRELTVDEITTLTATINPSNATNQNATWSSSNPSVASVDSNGVVTAKSAGQVTITVTTANGKTAQVEITVNANATADEGNNEVI